MPSIAATTNVQAETATAGPAVSRPLQAPAAWPAAVLSMILVAGLFSLLYARNSRYFFIDDAITGEMPNRVGIGRILLSGEFPWLNTDFVNGGAHAIEYSHGLFNPLLTAFAVLLATMDDMALGGFLLILVHALILTAATAWLGRLVGLGTAWTVAFAVSVGFAPYSVAWNAAAWYEGLTHFAWLVLAIAAAFAFHLSPKRRYGWLVLFATFSTLTSGWPLAIPFLGLFAFVLLLARLAHRMPIRETAWLAAWFAGGLVSSLVAIYPLLTSSQFGSRNSAIANTENFLVAPVEGLLQFANPGYYGFFNSFGGPALQPLPHFYVAWFVLPALVFWQVRPLVPRVAVLMHTTVAMLVVSALGSLGPERLVVFRFPTRFLQYAGFFLLLLVVLRVANGRFVASSRRLALALGLAALLVVNALQADPDGLRRIAVFGGLLLLMIAVLFHAHRASDAGSRLLAGMTLIGGTAGFLLLLALTNPQGRGVDWGFPHDLRTVDRLSLDDYTLYYGDRITVEGYSEFRPSMIGVLAGDRQINGYTSLGNRFFRENFPMNDRGDFELGDAAAFSAVDPGTGLQMLELLRVDQVISILGPLNDEIAGSLGQGWRLADTGDHTATYRHQPYALPGLVSYASPGLTVGPGCELRHSRECVEVRDASAGPGQVVFARLWFPGYRATFNGEPVPVERYNDMLVSVTTPPGETGQIEISYRSPGFVPLTLLALLTLAALAFGSRFLRPDPAPGGP